MKPPIPLQTWLAFTDSMVVDSKLAHIQRPTTSVNPSQVFDVHCAAMQLKARADQTDKRFNKMWQRIEECFNQAHKRCRRLRSSRSRGKRSRDVSE